MNGLRITNWMAWAGLVIALASGIMLALAGPGYRLGWWELGTAFSHFRWAAWGGVAGGLAGILALLGTIRWRVPGALARGIVAVLVGVAVVGVPWYWQSKARSVPPIHDISTDLENPPAFEAILPLREDAPNPAEYGGEEIARQQREAYPDLESLTFSAQSESVFQESLAAAEEMDWEIVEADPESGRIEAVATTAWFGFKDDVVIRIRDRDGNTRVDVRSVSRVGRSDVGANAERIRAFRERLEARIDHS